MALLAALVAPAAASGLGITNKDNPEVKWNARVYLALINLAIYLPAFIISGAYFMIRRDEVPIRPRLPMLVIVSNSIVCLYQIFSVLRILLDENYSCAVAFWQDYLALIVFGGVYVTRLWNLYVRHAIASGMYAEYVGEMGALLTGMSQSGSHSGLHSHGSTSALLNPDDLVDNLRSLSFAFARNQSMSSKQLYRTESFDSVNPFESHDRQRSGLTNLAESGSEAMDSDAEYHNNTQTEDEDTHGSKRKKRGSTIDEVGVTFDVGSSKVRNRRNSALQSYRKVATWRHYEEPFFLWKLILSLTAIGLIFPIVFSVLEKDELRRYDDECKYGLQFIYGIYIVMYALVCAFFLRRIRAFHVSDSYYLADELKHSLSAVLILFTFWLIFRTAPKAKDINYDDYPFSTFFALAIPPALLYFSVIVPLRLSFKKDRLSGVFVPDQLTTLRGVLSQPASLAAFREYLISEFAVEALLFWEEVQHFKMQIGRGGGSTDDFESSAVADNSIVNALNIYQKYISPNAPMPINVSESDRELLRSTLHVDDSLTDDQVDEYAIRLTALHNHSGSENDEEAPNEINVALVYEILDRLQKLEFVTMEDGPFVRFFDSPQLAELAENYASNTMLHLVIGREQ